MPIIQRYLFHGALDWKLLYNTNFTIMCFGTFHLGYYFFINFIVLIVLFELKFLVLALLKLLYEKKFRFGTRQLFILLCAITLTT